MNDVPSATDELVYARIFEAPRELVFRCMIEPEHLSRFWGPVGTSAPLHSITVDPRPGGAFETVMVNDADGSRFPTRAVYVEVVEPERLVWRELHSGMTVTSTFRDLGDSRTEVRIEQGQIKILERVEFENNSAKLRKQSDGILEAVLKVMNEHPEFTKLSVEGHTDSRGAANHNLDLSRRRAASVMKWLVDHGIGKDRLSSQGLGMTKPIDTNDTDQGRQNNRRVEFHILEKDGKPLAE